MGLTIFFSFILLNTSPYDTLRIGSAWTTTNCETSALVYTNGAWNQGTVYEFNRVGISLNLKLPPGDTLHFDDMRGPCQVVLSTNRGPDSTLKVPASSTKVQPGTVKKQNAVSNKISNVWILLGIVKK